MYVSGFPDGASGKESTCNAGDKRDVDSIPGSGRSPGGGNGNPSSILAWRIPWTEDPSGLWSIGSHRVGDDLVTNNTSIPQPVRSGGEQD